jgi:hypothetical protein
VKTCLGASMVCSLRRSGNPDHKSVSLNQRTRAVVNTCRSAINYGDLDERSAGGYFLLRRRRPARLSISFDLSEYQVNARLRKTPRGEQRGSSKPTGGNCRHHSIASPIHPVAISSSG